MSEPIIFIKDLLEVNQDKSQELVNNVNDGLVNLINSIIKKEIPENKNLNEIIDIVKIFLDFNNQQKGKGFKILTPLNKGWKY